MNWQPIEMAPKDGQHVLLAVTLANAQPYVAEGYFEADDQRGWFAANTHWTDYVDGSLNPSHWMPLPEPPKTTP